MVQSVSSQASQLTLILRCVNYWAVTGTPVPKTGTVEDMNGLLKFLKIPISLHFLLNDLSTDELLQILCSFVHRNTKKNIEQELQLPPQNDQIVFLDFKPIERQYYQDLITKAKEDLKNDHPLSPNFSSMSFWLLRLRQTCCHPNVADVNRTMHGDRAESMMDILLGMLNRTESSIFSDKRQISLLKITKCHILEYVK
jgi:E3 ubiquitin-protein ligase SHPRH